jgi:hypothetical protein
VYVGFLLLAPRFHALGKSRGYMVRWGRGGLGGGLL